MKQETFLAMKKQIEEGNKVITRTIDGAVILVESVDESNFMFGGNPTIEDMEGYIRPLEAFKDEYWIGTQVK